MVKRLGVFLVCAIVVTLGAVAGAAVTQCQGALTGTFDDIVVPAGAVCYLQNSIVTGDITIFGNALFSGRDNIVGGNITSHNANLIEIQRGQVGGRIELKGTTLIQDRFVGDYAVTVNGVTVSGGDITVKNTVTNSGIRVGVNHVLTGDVSLKNNLVDFGGPGLTVNDNQVAGDLDVDSTEGDGPKTVQNNVVGDTVKCKDNDPPFVGGPNTATRFKGQCF
jgi:hypothetical protein